MILEDSPLPTSFAPAERATAKELDRQTRLLMGKELLPVLFDSVEQMVLVINEHRQIVFANRSFVSMFGSAERSEVIGLRPGEALDCTHSSENAGGCGTTQACSQCGVTRAILAGQGGATDVRECRIARCEAGDALDLMVSASPLDLEGERFTVLSVRDISSQKRREVLERMFFHDILNTAMVVKGLAEVIGAACPERQEEMRKHLLAGALIMVEEIASQKMLCSAERGELQCSFDTLRSLQLTRAVAILHRENGLGSDRTVDIDPGSEDVEFFSDQGLLSRVLSNMIKNALEATAPGSVVTVGCKREAGRVKFWVHNPEAMAPEVQLQVFQRSFSTKGPGRGVGTYSMKLLTERYLQGRVAFGSTTGAGTTFMAWVPLQPRRR